MGLVFIENAGIKAGILPEVGGRIVSFQRTDGENVLESNPELWDEPSNERIEPSPFQLDFKAYNGHEVWVGPQSQWWKQQNLNAEKFNSDLFWPPDPYVSFDKYEIKEHSGNSITIEGSFSPISGIRFRKQISIDSDGVLTFEVKMKNLRDAVVCWDIWLITRVGGHNLNFVPVDSNADVTLGEPSHSYQGTVTYKVTDGFFSFTPLEKDKNYEECTGKAYIKANKPYIATLCGKELFVLEFEHHDPKLLHPEQSEIELYNFAHAQKEKSLLELEYHTPYYKLQPQEEVSTTSKWKLISMKENCTENEVKEFLTTFAPF